MQRSGGGNPKDQTETKPAAPPESDKEQKRNLAYLVVLAGVSAGEMFKLQEETTVVGRGPKVAVRLNDEGVSREHCRFVRQGEKIVVEDMGSTNGTFCNGVRIERRELTDGDKIMVGSTTILKFTYHDYLEKEFAFADRHGGPLALIFIDIDFFKKINDSHGHQAGDFVLSELSQMMTLLLRTEDVLARFGGEEFTVLCRGSDLAGAKVVAERLRRAVADRKFTFGGKDIPVTISLGIVAIPESGITDHNSFLAAADRALYEAKRSGRNRVCVHGTEQTPPEPRKKEPSGPNRANSAANRVGTDQNRVTQERSAKAGDGDDPRGQ